MLNARPVLLADSVRPAAWIAAPGSRHRQLLGEIIGDIRPTGLTVVSTDSDFAKFRDVAWLNPVTGEERRPSA